MKKSLFSTAALLCAVSFNALQASHSNPYEMSQESTRQNRCIRVITEIPVEMAGFVMPRQSCEHEGLPGASESKKSDAKVLVKSLLDPSAKNSIKDESLVESVLQLLIALTKNLKIAPSVDDPASTSNNVKYLLDPAFGPFDVETQPTFGITAREASEEARAKSAEAIIALEKAKAAEEAVKKDRSKTEAEKEKAAKAVVAAREAAVTAARAVDSAATAAVSAGVPVFTYEDKLLTGTKAKMAKIMADKFAKLEHDIKTTQLKSAAHDVMDSPAVANPLTTNVALANSLVGSLRTIGATYADIRTYLSSKPAEIPNAVVREMALAALPS